MSIITNLTSGNGSGTSATTASITPRGNALIIASVLNHKFSTPNPVTPTISGNGLTWVQISTYNPFSDFRVTLFRAMGASPTAGAISISFGSESESDNEWSIDQCTGVDTSGTNGSGAVIQAGTNSVNTTSTGLTIALSAFQSQLNAAYGFIGAQGLPAGFASGSGFTQLSDPNGTTQAEWKNTASTAVNWTWNSTGASLLGIAIEIKTIVAGGDFLYKL